MVFVNDLSDLKSKNVSTQISLRVSSYIEETEL